MKKITSVLVANRGEIAIRVFRACHEMGIRTIAVYSKEDSLSLHRFRADESYLIGKGKKPVDAYLDIEEIIRVAHEHHVDAIHPGYGFLSENADLARRCAEEGITFIGPISTTSPCSVTKSRPRTAKKAGIRFIPGSDGPVMNFAEVGKVCQGCGFPIMLKAVNGGGGRGMRMAHCMSDLKDAMNEQNPKLNSPLAMTRSILKNTSAIQSTSKSKSWAMNTGMSSTFMSGTAPSSAAIRKSSKSRRPLLFLGSSAKKSATRP